MNPIAFWLPSALRQMVRKHFGRSAHRQVPFLHLSADPTGLRIRAVAPAYALEYCQPGDFPEFSTALPLSFLDQLGNRDQPVELSHPSPDILLAHWRDRGIPRSQEFTLPENYEPSPLPPNPATWSENPPELIAALREACATTDATSIRFAFHCLQLRGSTGEIAATDGRQGLLQSGFKFPFEETLLVGKSDIFQCAALQSESPVQVGVADTKWVIRIGHWTCWLPIEVEARFPRLEDSIPSVSAASTILDLDKADLKFLREHLCRLPGTTEDRAVTFDLNGSIVVRAAPTGTSVPTELVLTRSHKSGEDLQLCFDRRFFARVAAMELPRLHLYGADGVICASDERHSYVWMPYASANVVKSHPAALRVESAGYSVSKSPFRRTEVMPANPTPPTAEPTPACKTRTRPCQPATTTTAIEAALALREQARGTLRSVNDLIRQLKTERKQQRLMTSTLASLTQLQHVA